VQVLKTSLQSLATARWAPLRRKNPILTDHCRVPPNFLGQLAFDTHSLLGLGLVTLRSIGVQGMARNDFQGSLDLLVLKTLAQRGKLHGYGIVLHIQRASEELLRVEEGSLYPALHRMEQSRWINSEWALTETNRRAKYYQLTAVGRKKLREAEESFEQLVKGIRAMLKYA
jgi:PadR family transcriptional regulator, regulatory protein PadR